MDNPAYSPEIAIESGVHKNDNSIEHTYTYDEAIGLAHVGRFHYILLFICGICFMAVTAETVGVSMIMPLVRCDLNATQVEQGILMSAGLLGIVLSSHMAGFLADTWGRVRTLRYSLSLAACATVISSFSVNIWMLSAFRFLNGFFIAGCQACVFSLCGEFHSHKSRTRYVTLLAIFLPIALMYLPGIALLILPLNIEWNIFGLTFVSWRAFLIIQTLLAMTGLLGLRTMPESPKYTLIQGDHDAALEILRHVYAKNTGENPESFPVKKIELQASGASLANIHGVKDALKLIWSQTVPLFYKERVLQTFNVCFSLMVVYGVSQGTFMWYPTILKDLIANKGQGLKVCTIVGRMELTGQSSSTCDSNLDIFMFQILTLIGGVFTLVYLVFAYTIDIIGKANLLMIWLVLCGICAVAVHWVSEFNMSIIIFTLIVSIGNCGGIISTISMEFFPTQINAMGMCFVMMMGRLGAVAGGNIVGLVIVEQCDLLFWAYVGIIIMLIALASVMPQRKPEPTVKEENVAK